MVAPLQVFSGNTWSPNTDMQAILISTEYEHTVWFYVMFTLFNQKLYQGSYLYMLFL